MERQRDRQLRRTTIAVGWVVSGYLTGLLYAVVDRRSGDESVLAVVAIIALIGALVTSLVVAMIRDRRHARRHGE